MLVSNRDAFAILGFLEAGPEIFRHFGMGGPAQFPFQRFEGGWRKAVAAPRG